MGCGSGTQQIESNGCDQSNWTGRDTANKKCLWAYAEAQCYWGKNYHFLKNFLESAN